MQNPDFGHNIDAACRQQTVLTSAYTRVSQPTTSEQNELSGDRTDGMADGRRGTGGQTDPGQSDG